MKVKVLAIFMIALAIASYTMAVTNFMAGNDVCGVSNILMATSNLAMAYFFYRMDIFVEVLKAVGRKVFHLPAEEDSDSDVIPEDELTDDQKRVKRMAEEYDQLAGRLFKLCAFIETDKFKALSEESQFLLTQQRDAMNDYVKILRQRIELECEGANLKTEYPLN